MAALAASRAYSESITLAFGGLILLLVLAVPTIRASLQEDWLKVSIVAACLFDQFCDPIGGRPIDHDVSVPLEDFPDAVVKLTPATEDNHFYDHVDLDFPGGATIVRRADFFEQFDFFLSGFCASVVVKAFFASDDETTLLLSTFGMF